MDQPNITPEISDLNSKFAYSAEVASATKAGQILNSDLQKKAQEYLAGWQRAQADYANLQKQMSGFGQDLLKQAKMNLVKEILPTLTYLETALEHAPEDLKNNPWLDGIKHIAVEIETAFGRLGLTRIKTIGEKFNPLIHEAAGTEKTTEQQTPETITREISPGFMLGDIVIQPARVIVSSDSKF